MSTQFEITKEQDTYVSVIISVHIGLKISKRWKCSSWRPLLLLCYYFNLDVRYMISGSVYLH